MNTSNSTSSTIRTPCCAILGHVDVGKTKLLDYMRRTETEEASGITQQIGTTLYTKERLLKLVGALSSKFESFANLDSLLMIDTPGHACFDTIRYVALMVTDVVVLVIDMIKGIEKQTSHILSLLKKYEVPFVICLNKMDKIYNYIKPTESDALNLSAVVNRMGNNNSKDSVLTSYMNYVKKIQIQLSEHEINSELYYQNRYPKEFINIVPISAETGEGIPDLIMLVGLMAERRYLSDKLIDSNQTYGYILDTHYDKMNGRYLVAFHRNGMIRKGDTILVGGVDYKIKHLLTNTDNREIKSDHKFIRADFIDRSMGYGLVLDRIDREVEVEIEPASMYVSINPNNPVPTMDMIARSDYGGEWEKFLTVKGQVGIQVVAPSYIMMDGLLNLLKSYQDHPCSIERFKVGKIDKKDIIISMGHMDGSKDPVKKLEMEKYSVILYYDPAITTGGDGVGLRESENLHKDIITLAKATRVTIIQSNVIYDLVLSYHRYLESIDKRIDTIKAATKINAIAEIIPKYIFRTTNPMVFGVIVRAGEIRYGVSVYSDRTFSNASKLGKIESIQKDNNEVSSTRPGDAVCLKIETTKIIGKDVSDHATLWFN